MTVTAYLTPDNDVGSPVDCRQVSLRRFLWPYFNGLWEKIIQAENWEQFGDMSPEECAQEFLDAFDDIKECDVGVPTGTIIAVIFPAAITDGWLPMDDDQVVYSKSDYPDLYSIVPAPYRNAGGVDTFTLPDMSGRVLVGAGGWIWPPLFCVQGGQHEVVLTADQLPPHTHDYDRPRYQSRVITDPSGGFVSNSKQTAATSSVGEGEPVPTMPPYTSVCYAIKT